MLRYWLWLATRKGLSPRGMCAVLHRFSDAEQVYYAPEDAYPEKVESLLDKDLSEAETILSQCAEHGIRIITMQDAAYPARLRALDDAPAVLFCKGDLPDLNIPAVAVVGTRKASVYGMTQAKRFGYGLARCGCAVISGGALGVDTQALRGAVLAGGPAIAVLGCGLDVDYPKSNRELFRQVAKVGCLISEYPPGTEPYAYHFPRRNRIISGLSLGVLVTEAPAKSGALITADHALEQGRDVFVIPANIGVRSFDGNLRLLRDGALPVGEVWDILQEYAPQYPQKLKKVHEELPDESVPQEAPDKKVIDKEKNKTYIDLDEILSGLTEAEQVLASLLRGGAGHIDDLVAQSGMTAASALASLTVLEVKGIVKRPSPRMYELAEK